MAGATQKELAEMAALEVRVRELLEVAEDEADSFISNLLNPAAEQIAGAVKVARELYRRWATTKREWARDGVDSSGKRYPVASWMQHGDEIASALAVDVGLFWERSTYNAVTVPLEESAREVVEKVEKVADALEEAAEAVGEPWPLAVKVGLAGGGALLAFMGLGYGVRSFRGLLGGGT